MAYEEYKNSGQCSGMLLYQLCKIGVPVTVVSSVIFSSKNQEIMHNGSVLCDYFWVEDDKPIFCFKEAFKSYALLPQDYYYIAFQSLEDGGAVPLFAFTKIANYAGMRESCNRPVSFVADKFGQHMDMCLGDQPSVYNGKRNIQAKADALRQAFCTPKRTKR